MKKMLLLAAIFPLMLAAGGLDTVEAAKRKPLKRESFTAAQREKIRAEGRRICRKQYGASATLFEVDYYHRRYVCGPN
jgi:hypothetical protein